MPSRSHLAVLALLVVSSCSAPEEVAVDGGGGGIDGGRLDGGLDAGVDPCQPNPCRTPGQATCRTTAGGGFECACDPGFRPDGEGGCEEGVGCEEGTCGGRGDCSEGADGPICACELGYAGDRCEGCDEAEGYLPDGRGGCALDPCDPNPCTEEGRTRCVAGEAGGFRCECGAGTHLEGDVCVPDTTCMETSCNGHGACDDGSGRVTCLCDEGWTDEFCDRCDDVAGYHADGMGGCTTDPCLPNPCTSPNRSVCSSADEGVSCACDGGFHLEGDSCVADETCAADSCSMHGACAVVEGRVSCTCETGYAGTACESCDDGFHADGAGGCTDDPCLPNPCTAPNQGQCDGSSGAAVCGCDEGYHPDGVGGCTDDPCVPDPCAATGQACRVDGLGDAECYTPACDDGEDCTDDEFVAGTGCVFTARGDGESCSSTLCVSDQTCSGGVCGGGTPVVCDDGDPCTRDSCDDVTGCAATADDTLVPDDGVECTVDECTGGVESHTPNDAACDDDRYCNGAELCEPGEGADARGCVITVVPVAPPDEGPCRYYGDCDEDLDGFPLITLGEGESCDDGIHCTSGDVCDGSGRCAGTPGECGPDVTCETTSAAPATVDVPVAELGGHITLGGAELASDSPYSSSLLFYLVAKDTGAWHHIHTVPFGGCCGGYTRGSGSEDYLVRVVPGVYDLLYRRGYSTDSNVAGTSPPDDPFVDGLRYLQRDVLIPAGSNRLDIDVGVTDVSGHVTLNGAELATGSPYSSSLLFYLVAKDTGAWHHIHSVPFGGCCGDYTRGAGSEDYAARVPPGTYDLLYRRGYSTNSNVAGTSPPDDPFVDGLRYLQRDVVISGSAQTLDIDVGATELSGHITQNGAELATESPYSSSLLFYLVAKDTGAWHHIHTVPFGGCCGDYTRGSGSEDYAVRVPPGTYDLLYRRSYSTDRNVAGTSPPDDPFVDGLRYLQRDVVISGSAQSLDIDVGVTDLSGHVTLDGGELATESPYSDSLLFYLVAKDTGAWHHIHSVAFGGCCGSYSRATGSEDYAARVPPGTYDLLFRRGYRTDTNVAGTSPPDDPFVDGLRYLQRDVVISGSAQTLDVDVAATNLSGHITQDGAELATSSPYSSSLLFYLVARDTGAWHHIHSVAFGGCCGSYSRATGSEDYAARVPPGTYDLLFRRGYRTDTAIAGRSPLDDPFVAGLRILRSGVTITGASQALDIDVPTAVMSAHVTLGGAELATQSPYSSSLLFYLVPNDQPERAWHHVHSVGFGGCCGDYSRATGSEDFSVRAPTGTYDLLYRRGYRTDTNVAGVSLPDDPFVDGLRYLGRCLTVD